MACDRAAGLDPLDYVKLSPKEAASDARTRAVWHARGCKKAVKRAMSQSSITSSGSRKQHESSTSVRDIDVAWSCCQIFIQREFFEFLSISENLSLNFRRFSMSCLCLNFWGSASDSGGVFAREDSWEPHFPCRGKPHICSEHSFTAGRIGDGACSQTYRGTGRHLAGIGLFDECVMQVFYICGQLQSNDM